MFQIDFPLTLLIIPKEGEDTYDPDSTLFSVRAYRWSAFDTWVNIVASLTENISSRNIERSGSTI